MTQHQTSQKSRHGRTKKVLNASPPTSRVRFDESSPSGPIEGRSFSFKFVNGVRSLASLEDLDEMTVRDLEKEIRRFEKCPVLKRAHVERPKMRNKANARNLVGYLTCVKSQISYSQSSWPTAVELPHGCAASARSEPICIYRSSRQPGYRIKVGSYSIILGSDDISHDSITKTPFDARLSRRRPTNDSDEFHHLQEQWLMVRGTQIFKLDCMMPYLLMNCFRSDQTYLEGTGYFYDSLRECATHFEDILKTNPGLKRQFRGKKPGSSGDGVHEETNQTRRGSDKVPFRECSGSECTNLSDDDSYRTGGSDESRNSSDEIGESSEQDREPCSQNRLSKVTGLLAEYSLPAGLDRNKDYIGVDCDSEHSEWEGHSHPNTDPPSTKSTITNETVDQIWKGDGIVFRNPQKSQNTRSYEEDISQTEGFNATPRKSQNKNFGSKNSYGSRKDPDETHETLGQDQIPRSRGTVTDGMSDQTDKGNAARKATFVEPLKSQGIDLDNKSISSEDSDETLDRPDGVLEQSHDLSGSSDGLPDCSNNSSNCSGKSSEDSEGSREDFDETRKASSASSGWFGWLQRS